MTSVERLQAAIHKLKALKASSTPGTWVWDEKSSEPFPQGDQSLLATDGAWKACEYNCSGGTPTQTRQTADGHDHLVSEAVLYGWGYDASGIEASPADRDLIVTLHRTIDAQLALLVNARARALSKIEHGGIDRAVWSHELDALTLADAILGEA